MGAHISCWELSSSSAEATRANLQAQLNQLHSEKTSLLQPAATMKTLGTAITTLEAKHAKAVAHAETMRAAAATALATSRAAEQQVAVLQNERCSV